MIAYLPSLRQYWRHTIFFQCSYGTNRICIKGRHNGPQGINCSIVLLIVTYRYVYQVHSVYHWSFILNQAMTLFQVGKVFKRNTICICDAAFFFNVFFLLDVCGDNLLAKNFLSKKELQEFWNFFFFVRGTHSVADKHIKCGMLEINQKYPPWKSKRKFSHNAFPLQIFVRFPLLH